MDAVLKKDRLDELITKLGYEVIAPVRKGTTVSFETVSKASDIAWDYANSVVPPKKIFFPQTEELFAFDGKTIAERTPETIKRMVLGIRPCDARSFAILDPLFTKDFKDPYYIRRRENTVLVGLACAIPGRNCFCTSLGAGPFDTTGLDLLLVDMGDRFLVRSVTEKGKTLLTENEELFEEATDEAGTADEIRERAESAIKRTVDVSGLPEKLKTLFDHPVWEDMAQTCLGCYNCTYLCPTCHCFDIQDEVRGRKGRRIRVWDSCSNPEYTLHGSGYNPRPGRKNRMRNRILHKYQYYPDNFGVIACVGCGRCASNCPVGLSIVEELSTLGGI
ncbi:MAG: 4Fe-4S dicluster domain-containing protein [Candidatus Undinarchaeales archaeon]|jgi:ferredoxin|nr:4Fe-4S dicluster domain-containing protein [Candidatus Undinarchaeales archaeon]MDP7491877.1 4Fe-4S dicluster domain-containing protein [Candidatus Undinarchaeales archaeon]